MVTVEQVAASTSSISSNVSSIEIAFSPQNEVDNHIKSTLGYFDIGEYIGDPRQTFYSDYPDLETYADSYFGSPNFANNVPYYNPINYIRLIKYFDNSLFKMIKDFVPARTNLKSGIVIKQHLLERSKVVQPQVTSSNNYYSGSIVSGFITGSTGGTFNDYNSLTPEVNNTQSWYESIKTPLGLTQSLHDDQAEFYNGELPGTIIETSDGELNNENEFKYPSTEPINYSIYLYPSNGDFAGISYSLPFFLSLTPGTGSIALWYDTGSIITTAPVNK